MKHVNFYSLRKLHKHELRKLNRVSKTQPDQTMSMRTILDRYSRGIPLESPVTQPYYNEDPDNLDPIIPPGVNYATLDLTDKQAIRETIVREMEDITKRDKITRETRKKDRLRQEILREVKTEDTTPPTPPTPPAN